MKCNFRIIVESSLSLLEKNVAVFHSQRRSDETTMEARKELGKFEEHEKRGTRCSIHRSFVKATSNASRAFGIHQQVGAHVPQPFPAIERETPNPAFSHI